MQFTRQVTSIVALSRDHALRLKFTEIGPDLFLYAIIKNEIGIAFHLLKNQEFKREDFINSIETKLEKENANNKLNENISLTQEAEVCLQKALNRANQKISNTVNSGQLLMSITETKSILAIQNKYQIPTSNAINHNLSKSEFAHLARNEKPRHLVHRIISMIKNWFYPL